MALALNIYDTQTMVKAIDTRKAYAATNFITNKFFPASLEKINDRIITIDIVKGSRKVAAYQSHKIAGSPATKNTFSTQQLEPETLCPYYDIDVDDILNRLPGQNPFSSPVSPVERAAEKLGWYMWDLMQLIFRRIEVDARGLLLTGKLVFKGKGVDKEIDYNRNENNEEALEGAALWSATTADPIGDLDRWRDVTAENGGRRADQCIMGSGAWNAFRSHEKVLKQLDNRRMVVGFIEKRPDVSYPKSVSYRGEIDGLEIWTYSDWYIDPDTGVSTPYIPAEKVILGSSEAENHLYYGLVKTDVEAGPVAVPILPRTWVEKKPSVRYLEMGSSPLLGMQEPDTTFVATVLEE